MMDGLKVGGPGSIEMGNETKRRATYADLEALPENMIGQIIDGELIAMSMPAIPHAIASSVLSGLLVTAFQIGRPETGSWWILKRLELHFGEDVLVPDIAGWQRERMPQLRRAPFFTLAPDWVCEVLSPSTTTLNRKRKREIYAREGVEYVWLVDPDTRTLEVFRRREGQWVALGTHSGEARIRAEPFEALELDLGLLWPPELEAP
jgi:Uma2 family endonuclease